LPRGPLSPLINSTSFISVDIVVVLVGDSSVSVVGLNKSSVSDKNNSDFLCFGIRIIYIK
jgi:hypothetical protein